MTLIACVNNYWQAQLTFSTREGDSAVLPALHHVPPPPQKKTLLTFDDNLVMSQPICIFFTTIEITEEISKTMY